MAARVDRANLRRVIGASALAVGVLQAATAQRALAAERRDYADVAWGPGLASVAVISAVVGNGDRGRRIGLAAASTLWAARLTRLMLGRVASKDEEDPRYSEFLEGDGTPAVLTKVFATQAVSQLIVASPIMLAAASELPRGARRRLAPVGLALMLSGTGVEALADQQKDAYRDRDDEDKPDVLDTGLWGWSRHPNYFGDSLVWDGAWLAGAASAPGAWLIGAPALMSYLLMFATGAKRTEKRMQDRPGYSDYQDDVAFFVPNPAKHR